MTYRAVYAAKDVATSRRLTMTWHVVRERDMRIVAGGTLYQCCAWIRSWGQTDFAKAKKGTPISKAERRALGVL